MSGVDKSTVEFLGKSLPVELNELPHHLVQPLIVGIIHLFEDVRNHNLDKNIVRERLYEIMVRMERDLLRESQSLKSWTVARTQLLNLVFSFNGKSSLEHQGT